MGVGRHVDEHLHVPVFEGHERDAGVNNRGRNVCRGCMRNAIIPIRHEIERNHGEGEQPEHKGGRAGPRRNACIVENGRGLEPGLESCTEV